MAHNLTPAGYDAFLETLKTRIRETQIRAALSANRDLGMLYWHIGRDILSRQRQQGWGAKVIDRLAQDLCRSFPTVKGFSARNLKYTLPTSRVRGGLCGPPLP